MIVPNVPVAGAQQDSFKPDRAVKPSAASGLAQDSLAELPVNDPEQRQHSGSDHQERPGVDGDDAPREAPHAKDAGPGAPELPRKGLLVDIRV